MAGGAYEYTIALVDKISAPARAATSALGGLKTQLSAVESLKAPTAPAAAATAPASAATSVGGAAADTAPAKALGSSWTEAADAIKTGEAIIGGAITGIRTAVTSLASGDVTGAISGLTDSFASLAKTLDLVAPGLGEIASAAISVAGGVAGATVGIVTSLAKFTIASTEAKRASLAQWDALGEGKISGAQVDSMLDDLRKSTGLTKESLAPLTTGFLRMGITGKGALESLTTAAAAAEATNAGGGEAFTKLFQKVNAAAEGGQKLKIPFKQLQAQLIATGLNAQDLATAMGKPLKEVEDGLKGGTLDARSFGDAMQKAITTKGAGPLAAMASSAENLGNMLKEYIGDMFNDLGKDVAPFMSAVREAFGVLDSKASPLGASLKATIGDAMHKIFETLTKLVPVAREAFWTLVVYALKAYIAIAPIVIKIKDFITSATGMKLLSTAFEALWTALKAVGVVIGVVIAVVGTLLAVSVAMGIAVWNVISYFVKAGVAAGEFVGKVIGSVVALYASIIGWFVKLGARILTALSPIFDVVSDLFGQVVSVIMTVLDPVIAFVQSVWDGIVGAFSAAGDTIMGALSSVWDSIASAFSPDKAIEIANSLIDGLVGGIAGGAAHVADALKNVGQGAIDGVKGLLGIHSPSAVMMELGGHTAEGFAQGVDSGAGRAQGAITDAVAPPSAAPAGGGSGGGSGGVTIDVGGITLTVGAGASKETAAQIAEVLPAALTKAFEEIAIQMGGATGGSEAA
jgi:phage-related protein